MPELQVQPEPLDRDTSAQTPTPAPSPVNANLQAAIDGAIAAVLANPKSENLALVAAEAAMTKGVNESEAASIGLTLEQSVRQANDVNVVSGLATRVAAAQAANNVSTGTMSSPAVEAVSPDAPADFVDSGKFLRALLDLVQPAALTAVASKLGTTVEGVQRVEREMLEKGFIVKDENEGTLRLTDNAHKYLAYLPLVR